MKRVIKYFSGLALVALCASCTSVPVVIDNRVPENIDREKGREVTGSGAGFQLFWLIPINVNGRQARAWQQVLDKAGDDCVTDVEIQESWVYGFVGTAYRTSFRAKAYPKIDKN